MRNKGSVPIFQAALLLAVSCISLDKRIVFQPEPEQEAEQPRSGRIIETQNSVMPEWASAFIDGGVRQIESLAFSKDRYVFIGKNRGTNFTALRHWADNFSASLDFPRLVAERIEKRFTAPALLYPDDEYGEYFEILIKNASDTEYPPVSKEEVFWIKRQGEYEAAREMENGNSAAENRDIYEFFVLLCIDKITLQGRIRQLLAGVITTVPPTRAQNAAINRVRQNFFEGF